MQWRGVEPTCCTARSPVVSERAILWWSVRFKLLWNAGQVAKEASRGSRWDCWATAAASCLCSRHQSQARLLKQQGDQIKLEDPAIFSKNPRYSLLSNYLMTKWFQIWWSYVKTDTRGHLSLFHFPPISVATPSIWKGERNLCISTEIRYLIFINILWCCNKS